MHMAHIGHLARNSELHRSPLVRNSEIHAIHNTTVQLYILSTITKNKSDSETFYIGIYIRVVQLLVSVPEGTWAIKDPLGRKTE